MQTQGTQQIKQAHTRFTNCTNCTLVVLFKTVNGHSCTFQFITSGHSMCECKYICINLLLNVGFFLVFLMEQLNDLNPMPHVKGDCLCSPCTPVQIPDIILNWKTSGKGSQGHPSTCSHQLSASSIGHMYHIHMFILFTSNDETFCIQLFKCQKFFLHNSSTLY